MSRTQRPPRPGPTPGPTLPGQAAPGPTAGRPRGLVARLAVRVWADLRPLDPMRSIKAKLAILVITSVCISTLMVILALNSDTQIRLVMIFSVVASLLITQLLAEVWDWTDASGTRTVDSHVKALRRKIGANWIRTVHGVGYALESPTP